MQSKEIEDSIIYWANLYLGQQKYTTTEELLDGVFFHTILKNESVGEGGEPEEFGFCLDHLETTLGMLQNFYANYGHILEHSDYRDVINNDLIWNPCHVVLITELVIGVLLKADNDEKWIEQVSNMNDNYRACLVELIQKMSDLLESSPQSSAPKRSMTQKEVSLKCFESNKEVVSLKKNNAELREWVLNLESENKRLENTLSLTQSSLEQSVKANDDLYKKYEQASKNKDYEKVKSECDALESTLEMKEREIKALQIQHKDELERIMNKGDDFKHEIDVLKEQLINKKNEVNQLNIYKRIASRMDEVDKINLDLKSTISELKDDLKEKDRNIKQKEIEISNLNVNLEYRGKEIKDLKDKIMEIEAEVTKYRNIKVDLHGEIDQLNTELKRLNEELDDRNKRLEYAEQMNFNEYSNEGLNFDLSERIKTLEEQNEELRVNHDHTNTKELKTLETKLDELQREKKELIRTNQRTQVKYERYEKEREHKMLAKDKIKLLQKELTNCNMEKKRVSEQLLRSYQEIARLKNYENENKSLKKDRLDLLEELRKSNKENQKLQTKLICFYETKNYGDESQQDSDFESPINNENTFFNNSRLFSNSKDKSQLEFNIDKSADMDEDEFCLKNSRSMIMQKCHKKNISLSKYLNTQPRLNETVISSDRNTNRFKKKVILEKEKEIEDKNKEIEEISRRYEDKIQELNKSRNDERSKYEQKLQGLSFKTFNHRRSARNLTQRANTPVSVLNDFLPEARRKAQLDQIEDDSDDMEDEEEPKSMLFSKLEEMTGRYETLRKSIASQIHDNHKDSETVHDMVTKIFDDDGRNYNPTTKSTCSNDFSEFDFLMASPQGRNGKIL